MKVIDSYETMYSLGVLWNVASSVSREMTKQIATEMPVIQIRRYDMAEDYFDFAKRCYQRDGKQDEVLAGYLAEKMNRMEETTERGIVVFIAEIDNPEYEFIEPKGKYRCKQVADLKKRIREEFSSKVDNYSYDVLLHMSDSMGETIKMMDILEDYDGRVIEDFVRKGCKPYILSQNSSRRQAKSYSEILNSMKEEGKKENEGERE